MRNFKRIRSCLFLLFGLAVLSVVAFVTITAISAVVYRGESISTILSIPGFKKEATETYSLFSRREMRLTGVSPSRLSEVKSRLNSFELTLPALLTPNKIRTVLLEDPFIKSVKIDRCDLIGCWNINVVERRTSLLVEREGVIWLASADGYLLEPISQRIREPSFFSKLPYISFSRLSNSGKQPVQMVGEYLSKEESLTEEPFKGEIPKGEIFTEEFYRLIVSELFARSKFISESLGLQISSVIFISIEEFKVIFREYPFEIIFGGDIRKGNSVISEQVLRLESLLKRFKGKEEMIKTVDLPFRNVAVVKFF